MTALIAAAEKGHLEVLSLLFQNGADIHMENEVCPYVTRFAKTDHFPHFFCHEVCVFIQLTILAVIPKLSAFPMLAMI